MVHPPSSFSFPCQNLEAPIAFAEDLESHSVRNVWVLAASSKSSIHSALGFVGIQLVFSKTNFDHQEITSGNCTVLNSRYIGLSSQVMSLFVIIALKIQHVV